MLRLSKKLIPSRRKVSGKRKRLKDMSKGMILDAGDWNNR
jgi:hypothetical protein